MISRYHLRNRTRPSQTGNRVVRNSRVLLKISHDRARHGRCCPGCHACAGPIDDCAVPECDFVPVYARNREASHRAISEAVALSICRCARRFTLRAESRYGGSLEARACAATGATGWRTAIWRGSTQSSGWIARRSMPRPPTSVVACQSAECSRLRTSAIAR